MGSKSQPGKFDCYANAKPDEPMFILLARDPSAAMVVRLWAGLRRVLITLGLKPTTDYEMVAEAEALATQMEVWRAKNWMLTAMPKFPFEGDKS